MSKPRPRLSLGPDGAKPQTLPSEQNSSRIAYKARDERQSQPPGRGRGHQDGGYGAKRDERSPYASRDNRGEGAPRFGGSSERGERSGPRGPKRDERSPYANRDNRGEGAPRFGGSSERPARATSSGSSDPWRTAKPRPVEERAPRAPARARHISEELPAAPVQAAAEADPAFAPRGLASDERKIYGVNSCEQFYKLHPELVIRAYFTEAAARAKFGPLMKALAASKRAYHVISGEELEKVTDSQHHEGVCLVIKQLPELQLGDWLAALPADSGCCVLLLDGVANPHNLGAIMRTAAHYRVGAIISDNAPALRSGAAMRTAEGGALHVPVVSSGSLVAAMLALKEQGFTVYATSSRDSADLYRTKLPARCAFIMGEEQHGVSAPCMAAADKKLLIGGSGLVDSLNVSVAAALLSAEYWRQHEVVGAAKSGRSGKAKTAKVAAAATATESAAVPAKAVKARAVKAKPQPE